MIFVVVSTGHFDPLIRACTKLKDEFDFFCQIGSSHVVPPMKHVKYLTPEQLIENMERAEVVVTHAGTGMLSMLYRLKKRSVVIPKQIRYGEANDGQVELALRWAKLGMSVLCMDVNKLAEAILQCRRSEFSFPQFPSLGMHLNEVILSELAPRTRQAQAHSS